MVIGFCKVRDKDPFLLFFMVTFFDDNGLIINAGILIMVTLSF